MGRPGKEKAAALSEPVVARLEAASTLGRYPRESAGAASCRRGFQPRDVGTPRTSLRQQSLHYGKITERLTQTKLSQLSSFSVPSNSFAKVPPAALNENSFTRSGGLVVAFLRTSRICSCLEI